MGLQTYLQRRHSQFLTTPALSDLGQIVDKPFKDVCSVQVAVIVHVDVHNTLGVWTEEEADEPGTAALKQSQSQRERYLHRCASGSG